MGTVPMSKNRQKARRSRASHVWLSRFMLGFTAPVFLIGNSMELRVPARGESVRHAWKSVGFHLSRASKRIADEQKSARET
jgi:hypothetical protein